MALSHVMGRRPLACGLSMVALLLAASALLSTVRAVSAAEQPAHADRREAIFGNVVNGAGAPVSGARVGLWRQLPKYRWQPPKSTVTSDEQGNFRFDGLPDAHYRLVVEKPGMARAFRGVSIEEHQQLQADVVVQAAAVGFVELKDESGKPVVGAKVREFEQRGPNGAPYFPGLWLEAFGIEIPASDATGRIQLPPLPAGEKLTLTLDHADFAPVKIADFRVETGATANAVMHRGVKLTMHLAMPPGEKRVSRVTIGLYDESWSKGPTTMRLCALPVDKSGAATIAVEPGSYRTLVLEHDDYFVTPDFEHGGWKNHILRITEGENDHLWFQLRRKVMARGRVINSETGHPLPDAWVSGEILNETVPGKLPVPPEKWVTSEGKNTDGNGEYTLALVAGTARVTFSENNYIAEADSVEFTVAADGSTVIPDIRVRPMPKIAGVVQNADGTPVSKAVVRLRGKYLRWMQPAVTDAAGRFELQPPWVPTDEKDQLQPVQPLVAFDPRRRLAARIDVNVGQRGEVVLKLEPHDPDWLLTAFAEEMTDWERGDVTRARAEKEASLSLRGEPAPELDGASWFNLDRPTATLADFRGKYVLLAFWFTACGPCHREFPAVKLIHELYGDEVVVIGVHNNSALPNAVAEHVARIGLPFPIVVDHSDGRLITRYQKHGLVPHYPSYVLIGPDGTVLLDDVTIPNPKLGSYKLEILHEYLHRSK